MTRVSTRYFEVFDALWAWQIDMANGAMPCVSRNDHLIDKPSDYYYRVTRYISKLEEVWTRFGRVVCLVAARAVRV